MAAGGFVEFGRVNGNLALSRAIGDIEFKRNTHLSKEAQIVTADPEITVHDVTGEEEFLVLACDGIWDCLSSQQVVDFVRREIAKGRELKDICEEAMDRCCAPDSDLGGVGCDNMTICIVALLNGRTKQEWYNWVKERVEKKIGWDTPEQIAPVFSSQAQGGSGAGAGGFGGGSVLQALAGGLAGVGGQGEEGEGRGLNIGPGGLAAALGGGRFVLRPGDPDERGEMTYEAHVVDDDDDEDEDEEGEGEAGTAKISEATDSDRPELTHQPEIVESPSGASGASVAPLHDEGITSSAAKVEVRPSTEGTGATAQHIQEDAAAEKKE